MKFAPFFSLKLTHSYFSEDQRPNFQIVALPETNRALKNHKCTLKLAPGELRVFVQVKDDGAPFIPLNLDATLRFFIISNDPIFALVTDLAAFQQAPAPLFTNAGLGSGNPASLKLISEQARAKEQFEVQNPAQSEKFILSGRPLPDLVENDFSVVGLGDASSLTDFNALTKTFTVDSTSAQKNDVFTVEYATSPERPKGVFAKVEIHNNDSLPSPSDGPGEFHIAFEAKAARWAYYLVSDASGSKFSVQDQGAESVAFGEQHRRNLQNDPDPSDPIANMLANKFPDLERWRFLSDEPVVCSRKVRKSIQLLQDGSQALAALPNPALQNFSRLNVPENGGVQKENVLYQIVKHLTN